MNTPSSSDNAQELSAEGGCACGEVRYRLQRAPMFVHCCHCRWCQRESGAAFALNAMVETAHIAVFAGAPEITPLPTHSGRGQRVARCPKCRVALWSHYGAPRREVLAMLRVGTLDAPHADADMFAPDIHIYTDSKQPWVTIPQDAPAPTVAEYYDRREYWPAASLERWRVLFDRG